MHSNIYLAERRMVEEVARRHAVAAAERRAIGTLAPRRADTPRILLHLGPLALVWKSR